MLNYEATKTLVHERQHQLAHDALLARLARRARRARAHGVPTDQPVNFTIVLPARSSRAVATAA